MEIQDFFLSLSNTSIVQFQIFLKLFLKFAILKLFFLFLKIRFQVLVQVFTFFLFFFYLKLLT